MVFFFNVCLWPPAVIIRQQCWPCGLRLGILFLTWQEYNDILIYEYIISINCYHPFIFLTRPVLMFVWYLSNLSVSVSCRRGATSSSPQQLQGSLSLLSLLNKGWTEDLRASTSHISAAPTLHSRHRASKRSRQCCLTTPGQRNVCERVSSDAWLCLSVFGLK